MIEDIGTFIQFVLAPQIISGLAAGVAVTLMALGLTIIFGLLDTINMAHGAFYALGGFLVVVIEKAGGNFWIALVLAPLILMLIGVLIERGLIRFVFDHKDRHTLTLLLTLGISMILEDLLRVIFGANPLKPITPIKGVTEILPEILIPDYRLFVILFGSSLLAGIWLLIFRSSLGAMIRAATTDRDMAAALGVPVTLVITLTFGVGVGLAGLSGVVLSPMYAVYPTMGHGLILMAFAIVIVGGLNSITGTIVAGLLLTQISSISAIFISPAWTDVLVFIVMVIVLIFKPSGLLGSAIRETK